MAELLETHVRGNSTRWVSLSRACEILGVDESTLRRWADAGHVRAEPGDRWLRNLRGTWRRMRSREVPHARVTVRFQGSETEAVADAEGMTPLRLPSWQWIWRLLLVLWASVAQAGPATTRIAAMSCSGGSSFNTKPLAPARSASSS